MMNLQERRLSMGFNQAELAAAAGISRTALSLMETGRLRPSSETRDALDRALDPFTTLTRLIHAGGPLAAAGLLRETARETGLAYALTLDVAAWLLTRYQSPATAWAYVKPLEEWESALRGHEVRRAGRGERATLILLRAPDETLADTHTVEGYTLVGHRRLVEDCVRLGGRHGLDGARIYIEFQEARAPGLRIDADCMLKVFEEVVART
jgi:transcriptional regulator with XRE-family HTH domain